MKFVPEDGGDFSASTAAAKIIQLKAQYNATAVLGMASSECEGAISVANRVQIPMIGNSCSIQDVVGSDCNYWFINGAPLAGRGREGDGDLRPEAVPRPDRPEVGGDRGRPRLEPERRAVLGLGPRRPARWRADRPVRHRRLDAVHRQDQGQRRQAVLVAISWGVQYAAFLQQAKAAGLFSQMQIVAPVGFPENSMVPGYGTAASGSTVQALLATKVLSQYGGSWTYVDQTALGKRFNQQFYKSYHYPPTTQANVAMADTWMLLSAIKAVGTGSHTLMQALTTRSFQTPYWTQPLRVQPGGRQLEVPAFATKFEKLAQPQYGVSYANKVLFVLPPSSVVGSATSYGCHVSAS